MEAQRMDAVGRLAGGLAHDLNNMLAVILGHAEILRERVTKPENAKSASRIRSAAVYGVNIVNRLLAFARNESLQPEISDLLRDGLPENIKIHFQPLKSAMAIEVDKSQFASAVLNLILNARDAMPGGGEIQVAVDSSAADDIDGASEIGGGIVAVSVIDNGRGMSADVCARAFEPFFTVKPSGRGSGLGLSMVRSFARQSGGDARIYSTVGVGTTVNLFLPRADAAKVPVSASANASKSDRSRGPDRATVMLVEDNDFVREATEAMLRLLNYDVSAFRDPEIALAELTAGAAPDILLSDIVLAGAINGRQFAAKAHQIRPGARVVLMTGYELKWVQELERSPVEWPVLRKPFSQQELQNILAG